MLPIDIENKSTIENINIYIQREGGGGGERESSWHHILAIPHTVYRLNCQYVDESTYFWSVGDKQHVLNTVNIDWSSSYEYWFAIIDMNAILDLSTAIKQFSRRFRLPVCVNTDLTEILFFSWNTTTGDNCSTEECLWITDDQNSQRQ